jgi:hypothetical protein
MVSHVVLSILVWDPHDEAGSLTLFILQLIYTVNCCCLSSSVRD